jgi:hypothetical protein
MENEPMNDQTNQPTDLSPPPASAFSKTLSEPPAPPLAGGEPPLGDEPNDRRPVVGPLGVIEAVLRHPRRIVYQVHEGNGSGRLVGLMLAVALAFVAVYGTIVGSFSGGVQWWAAPLKITAGLVVTAGICLPSLYIFAGLSGSSARLGEMVGALGGLLALATLLLIGFAPVAWLFSQSTSSVAFMGALHLGFWLIAAGFGVRFLKTAFRRLGLRSENGLNVWVVIFLLVSLQMTTALRPLIGSGDNAPLLPEPQDKKFFVAHWMDSMDASVKRVPSRGD